MTSDILLGLCVAAAIALPAWRFRALDASGAFAALMVGAVIFGVGGLSASVALIAFFVSGSLLAALPIGKITKAGSKEKFGRSWKQVMANGFVPMLAIIAARLIPGMESVFMLAYFASIAAACADSWGTEIGTRYGKDVRDVLTGQPLPLGLSGGMSVAGTIASLAGAGLIVLAAMLPLGGLSAGRTSPLFLAIFFGGFLGAVSDSVLGSSVQARYKCESCDSPCETAEHCGRQATLIAGYRKIKNNTVNFAASAIGALFAVGIHGIR